ncbi:hypothetical protein BSKO_09204 [Bryopsis sp. KO-2023]|nr:hypothetical protein BSKO_09204 [Bryopsis sp. KO-2023]
MMSAASSFRSNALGFKSRARCARPPTKRNLTIRAGIQPGVDLVTDGKVRLVRANELKAVLVEEGYKILDTRPDYENERAQVKGAIHVPYFSVDEGQDPLTWIRRGMHAGFGGVWNGVPLTKVNENFIEAVTKAVDGDKEISMVVTCSQGLRSLVSIKDLYDNGFTNLAWLYGGLNFAQDGVESDGDVTLAEANTGGVSKIVFDVIESFQKKDEGVQK